MSSDASAIAGKRVVICEDEGLTVLQMERALRRAGLQIVGHASTGAEASAAIDANRPDIILLDIGLGGDDGIEVARRASDLYRPCIVLVSGYADEEHIRTALENDVCAYISKPIDGSRLVNILERAWEMYKRTTPEAKGQTEE